MHHSTCGEAGLGFCDVSSNLLVQVEKPCDNGKGESSRGKLGGPEVQEAVIGYTPCSEGEETILRPLWTVDISLCANSCEDCK